MCALKIMEWNINGRSNYDGAYAIPPCIAAAILGADIAADIVILTEFVAAAGWSRLKSALEERYELFTTPYAARQNGILIAIRKGVTDLDIRSAQITAAIDSTHTEKPNFLQATVPYKGAPLTVIGVRVRPTGYPERKKQMDALLKHLANRDHVIIAGDFNNSKICGEERQKYNAVKEEYHYTRWGEPSALYETYNYHILKDMLEAEGFLITTPKGDKWSWVDKYKNKYKQDHIFSKGVNVAREAYDWGFVRKENGYGEAAPEAYKSEAVGLPDHAILTAAIEMDEEKGLN